MADDIFEDEIDFKQLPPGRQFAFADRMQSGVWVKLVTPFRTYRRKGQEYWWAASLSDGIKRACSADGVILDTERRVRPLRREHELEVPEFLHDNLRQ